MLHSPMNGSISPCQEVFTACIENCGSCFLARALGEGKKDEWPAFNDEWAILMESDVKSNAFEAVRDLYNQLRCMIPPSKDGSTYCSIYCISDADLVAVMQGVLEAKRNRSDAP